ncbi:MAG: magnesium-translocating P-type ATPase [Candidatus Kerfeldbacteria bacterium]|nr:magnesium-translocating P-type ATPase [Candidatus Kerfeldbacteria bacterium]
MFSWRRLIKRANQSTPPTTLKLSLVAAQTSNDVLLALQTTANGLTLAEAKQRLTSYGRNEVASEQKIHWSSRLLANFKDPLSLLLVILGVISYLTGDLRATILIGVMVCLSVFLRFFQEVRADRAAEKLKAMVRTTAAVHRQGITREIPLKFLVPGDIVHLSAGDMVPADLRLIESRDLFINQATLTGEALPVEKHAPPVTDNPENQLELTNICFMGTDVESGTATAAVVTTGRSTYLGSLAQAVTDEQNISNFDRGLGRFTWLMIRFILVMVPLVFLINGLSKGNWVESFLFALAVAVGLTPELLPMIVTVNLSKGALDMSRLKVIVKRLNAIQNFGAMDILCTDKTGTLTQGKVVLIKHVNIEGDEDESLINYAYLNSFYQTGLKNLLDLAVLKHDRQVAQEVEQRYRKIDEVPFDFVRRRMSVVVEDKQGRHLLICKGAIEEVLNCSRYVKIKDKVIPLAALHYQQRQNLTEALGQEGFRLIALAYRELPPSKQVYTVADEAGLTLLGFLAFLDPPKASAGQAIEQLKDYGVGVKILTGDNELVTRKICHEVGLSIERVLLGHEIEAMSEEELALAAEQTTVFDKLEPLHKQRIIHALQSRGHVIGFLGDGINDAPALKAADVGISVDSAVDIAKESSDIILLEKSLLVLRDGVREGRKIFGNITKYMRMAASSNFGNMLSVVGGSIFLPFLPMLPLQILTNNLLYDFSQVSIPTDQVDEEYLRRPRQWRIDKLKRFILIMGPVSSIFDYATFFLMLYVFNSWANPALFHTGWFVESLLTQTLIIHIIRTNKIPFIQSRASWPLILTTLLVVAVGVWLPWSPLAYTLGLVALPPTYWFFLIGFIAAYFVLTQLVKRWFTRRYGDA